MPKPRRFKGDMHRMSISVELRGCDGSTRVFVHGLSSHDKSPSHQMPWGRGVIDWVWNREGCGKCEIPRHIPK